MQFQGYNDMCLGFLDVNIKLDYCVHMRSHESFVHVEECLPSMDRKDRRLGC